MSLVSATAIAAEPAEQRIAVLPADVAGGGDRIEQTVATRLRDGLKRGPFEVVQAPSAAITGECVAPQCERSVAQAASAEYVIRTTITPKDNIYTVVLQARNADGDVVATAEDICEICGLAELGDLVSDRGAALAQQIEALSGAPPLVVVNTNPSGANVWVDDELIGRTPLEHEVTPGRHEVRVESDGFVPQKRTFTSVAGIQEEVEINLARAAVDTSGRKERAMIIGGAVGLVAGVALVGAGAPLIAIDDTAVEKDCNADAAGNCERLYDTIGLGAGLVGVGAAALVAGAVLLGIGISRKKKNSRVAATGNGLVVRF